MIAVRNLAYLLLVNGKTFLKMDDNNETISAFAFKTAKEIEQLVKERTNVLRV